MTWTRPSNPSPRAIPEFYEPYVWPVGNHLFFAAAKGSVPVAAEASVFDLLARRRSRRSFGPVNTDALGSLLWHTAGIQATEPSGYGPRLEQRPTPSAGALHPIHLLLKMPDFPEWYRYDGGAHALVEVPGSSGVLAPLLGQSVEVIASPCATRIVLIAEPGKTFAKYHHASSLIWRDAGALLGILSIAAEALGMHFCPLGITGEPWVSELCLTGRLAGVGMALIGSPDLEDLGGL
ncbi:hypothetical protein [Pseudomonas sp. NY15374]|uniref:hypothetical protein n=1 Tax=Pseudomonas sp. NY15374 TaxID=3400357 RepID=UPI003A86ED2D